jgi:hypothetical protein
MNRCIIQLKLTILNGVEQAKTAILTHVRNNGIRLGNRWLIHEEGTGSYEALVFRDMNSPWDSRYAMFPGCYTDY